MATNGLFGTDRTLLLVFIFFLCLWRSFALENPLYAIADSAASKGYEVHLPEQTLVHFRAKRQADDTTNTTQEVSQANDTRNQTDEMSTDAPSTPVNVVSTSTPSTTKKPEATTGSGGAAVTTTSTISPANIDIDSPKNPFQDSNVFHDYHKYYSSVYTWLENGFNEQWTELDSPVTHETLSKGHRVAAVIPLKFNFSFYGHELTKVTVATGGFIYMSPFLHQWLTATQYIAPLMANFDPSISTNSTIMYQSEDDHIIIEWKDMYLQDQKTNGGFHFQATLYANNTIKFAYKNIPESVNRISNNKHPVKIGLSDAYYNDTYVPKYDIKRRTIYEYHKVVLNQTRIISNSIVYITPMPTCNTLKSCETCSKHTAVEFDCKWCNRIGRCSDGLDWYRQHWDKQGCKNTHTVDSSACSSLPKPTLPNLDPHDSSMYDHQRCTGGDCDGSKTSAATVVIILVIAFILILVGGVGTWVYYAYTHPTSKSGMWLMEHRPSQLGAKIKFWKSSSASGAKYQTETVA